MAAAAPLSSEPHTPLWLTCVGIGLFFVVGLFLLFGTPIQPRTEKAVAAAPSAANTAAPASALQNARNMPPEAAKRLQERLRLAPGAPAGPANVPGGH